MLHGFAETVWQVRADDPGGTYRAVYAGTIRGGQLHCYHCVSEEVVNIGKSRLRNEKLSLIAQRLQLARKLAGKRGD